mmetsp:Transcript_48825/g.86991  ORF Transcript_48825/g.86991 Transcript_48825/m.86991 type:complete len:94 (-) Transcript_48825:429-710(-)
MRHATNIPLLDPQSANLGGHLIHIWALNFQVTFFYSVEQARAIPDVRSTPNWPKAFQSNPKQTPLLAGAGFSSLLGDGKMTQKRVYILIIVMI